MIGESLLGVVRLAHALTAAFWIGVTIVFLLAATESPPWERFRSTLRISIGVFIATGVLLAAARLGSAALPPAYVALLALKVGLGAWMFAIARRFGRRAEPGPWWRRPEGQVLGLGVVVYALAIALRAIYEAAIRG